MLKYKEIKISELKINPNNPRINDEAADKLVVGLENYGFINPVIVNKRDNMILAGHTRIKALKKMGKTSVPVLFVDMDETTARGFSLWDNKSAEFASWDKQKVSAELDALSSDGFNDLLTGFDLVADINNRKKTLDDTWTDDNCEMKIVPEFFEHHQCFIIVTHNEIDENFVREALSLTENYISKSGDKKVRKTNVIDVESLRQIWAKK